MRDVRQTRNLERLKQMVEPDKWMWAEQHALFFVRFCADMVPLDMPGDQAAMMLRAGAVRKGAEHLLMDIAMLEAEI